MEAVAMDKLVEKGEFRPQVAQAIAEALDITIKAANLVTVPMLDTRFAQADAKMEARFGAIEKSIEALKGWTLRLYVGGVIAFFSALGVDHHWIIGREDQLMAQVYARSDARFAEDRARSEARFAEERARSDARFAEQLAHSDQVVRESEARLKAKLDQIRILIPNASAKSGGGAGHTPPPPIP
jgi:hypothetical protein